MGTNSMWGQPPRVTTDANGNTTGLVGKNNAIHHLSNQRTVAQMGDSFVWTGFPAYFHVKTAQIATNVATLVLTETDGTGSGGNFFTAVDFIDVTGMPKAFEALNGSAIPLASVSTTSGVVTITFATSAADVALTNIKNGATIAQRSWRKTSTASIFRALEGFLGNRIKVPREFRLGWGGGGFCVTGAGYLPWSAQCRKLIKEAGSTPPNEVWVHLMTNDIESGKTLVQIQAEVRAGLEVLRAGGVQKVRLSKGWPRLSGTYTGDAAAKAAVMVSVNAWFDTLADDFVSVLDATASLQDTGLANFQPLWGGAGNYSGVVQPDGLHPSQRGGMIFALANISAVARDFPTVVATAPVPFPGTSAVAVTDVSGTYPSSWSAPSWGAHTNGTGTAVVTTDPATGEITVTLNAPTSDRFRLNLPDVTAGTVYEAETTVRPQYTLDLVSATASPRLPFRQLVDYDTAANGYIYINNNAASTTEVIDAVAFSDLILSAGDFSARAGSTKFQGQFFEFYGAGVGNPVVFKVKNVMM